MPGSYFGRSSSALSALDDRMESFGIVWDRLRLYWEGFRDIALPLPSHNEQRAILAYIGKETAKLDALHMATERTIALLRERRSALIAAAVVGKIELAGFS